MGLEVTDGKPVSTEVNNVNGSGSQNNQTIVINVNTGASGSAASGRSVGPTVPNAPKLQLPRQGGTKVTPPSALPAPKPQKVLPGGTGEGQRAPTRPTNAPDQKPVPWTSPSPSQPVSFDPKTLVTPACFMNEQFAQISTANGEGFTQYRQNRRAQITGALTEACAIEKQIVRDQHSAQNTVMQRSDSQTVGPQRPSLYAGSTRRGVGKLSGSEASDFNDESQQRLRRFSQRLVEQ